MKEAADTLAEIAAVAMRLTAPFSTS